MEPNGLFYANSTDPVAWECATCQTIYNASAKDIAAQCCDKTCRRCPAKLPKRWPYIYCEDCKAVSDQQRERERFEKAAKLTYAEYADEWIYAPDVEGSNHHYWSSLEELLEYCENNETEAPEYVYGCDRIDFTHIDLESALQYSLEEAYEGAADNVNDATFQELQEAVDAWCKDQKICWYEANYAVAIVIPSDEAPASTEPAKEPTPPEMSDAAKED